MRAIRNLGLGLTLLALALSWTACAARPEPPVRPADPPAVCLADVPEPEWRGRTNGDLLAWALALREAVRRGNADKRALREWTETKKIRDEF